MGATPAEAVVLKMALSDGDSARKNRAFLLTPQLAVAGVAAGSGSGGAVCVLSLVENFSPLLLRNVVVEQQGMVATRDRRAGKGQGGSVPFTEVLNAIPSKEARDIVTDHLVAGHRVKIEYEGQPAQPAAADAADGGGSARVSARARWRGPPRARARGRRAS